MTYFFRLFLIVFFTATCCAQNNTVINNNSKPLNVVLILADDQGAHLSSMDTKGISTPNVDKLSKNGMQFSNAFAVVASCSPSRSSIMTGMYPHANGHWRNTITPNLNAPDTEFTHASKTVDKVGVHEYITTLPELLKENGYYTGITQKFHMSPPWKFPYSIRNSVNNDPKQYEKFVGDFIKQADGKAFFLQANISPPHRNFDHHMNKFPEFLPNADSIQVPEYLPDTPEMRQDLRKYYGSVQLADACAGAIIKALKKKGVYENTLIIYTSDQGEPYHRAKASAYYAGLHVPFVVVGPNISTDKVSTQLVSLIDIMPTVLDFLGIDIPKTVQGKSLKSYLKDQTDVIERRTYVFGEHNSHGSNVREHYPSRMIFDGKFYYIRNLMPNKSYLLPADLMQEKGWGNKSYQATLNAKLSNPVQYQLLKTLELGRPAEELYDMEKDPGQLNNLIDIVDLDYSKKLNELRIAMDKWRLDTDDLVDDPMEIKTRLKRGQ